MKVTQEKYSQKITHSLTFNVSLILISVWWAHEDSRECDFKNMLGKGRILQQEFKSEKPLQLRNSFLLDKSKEKDESV